MPVRPTRSEAPAPSAAAEDQPLTLEALYRAHAATVARWASFLAGPGVDVEDVVHEVFLVAQRRLHEFRGDGKITTWLYRTTAHIAARRRRSEKIRGWLRGPGREAWVARHNLEQTPLNDLERQRNAELLCRVLDGIGERDRKMLLLFDLEGLSGEQVAALTGVKISTLRVWLFRARKMFMARFRALQDEDPRA